MRELFSNEVIGMVCPASANTLLWFLYIKITLLHINQLYGRINAVYRFSILSFYWTSAPSNAIAAMVTHASSCRVLFLFIFAVHLHIATTSCWPRAVSSIMSELPALIAANSQELQLRRLAWAKLVSLGQKSDTNLTRLIILQREAFRFIGIRTDVPTEIGCSQFNAEMTL